MLVLTFEEYIEHKRNNGIVDQKSRRTVCFVSDLTMQGALEQLREYQRAYKKKYCPDGYNGSIVEFRLLIANWVDSFVTQEVLEFFQAKVIKPGMAKELEGD